MNQAFPGSRARRAVVSSLASAVVLAFAPAQADEAPSQGGEVGTATVAAPVDAAQPPALAVQASAPQAVTPAGASAEPRQIEEVVVTATKRQRSIRDIPESITSFSGASLENQGKLNLNDFIQQSPGVTAAQGGAGFTRITMRGISTDTNPYAPNPSPVGLFIGDTAFTDPYIANIVPDLSAFDLKSVEVLKGPQGTLFGGAALSGAVRYELAEPVQGAWEVRGFSQFVQPNSGSSAWTSGAALNIPLLREDRLALRLDYVRRNYPGVYDDQRTGEKDVDHGGGNQYRAIMAWEPTADWKVKLTHLRQDFSAANNIFTADTPDGPRQTDQVLLPQASRNDFSLDSLELNYNFDAVRVVSLSSLVNKHAYFAADDTPALVGSPPPAAYPTSAAALSAVVDNSRAFSQEVRLQSTGNGPFQWLVGGYYYDYRMYFDINIDTPLDQGLTGPGSLLGSVGSLLGVPASMINQDTVLLDGKSNAKSHERAIFTDVSYKLWDRLDLEAGARFYSTSVDGGFVGTGILVLAENNLQNANTAAAITEKGINPKFAATYHFSKDISLYAAAAKGYRFGGIQDVPSTATNGVPPTYKSDSLWNYELGLRTGWFHNTLQADLTAFYLRYKNPVITQATQGIPINFNANVSSAISRGLESSLLWHAPVRGLSLSLAGALTDAHITSPFVAATGQQVEPGQEMPGTARTQGNAAIQYVRPIWLMTAAGNVGYNWIGKGYNDLTHDAEINGYGTLNAGLALSGEVFGVSPKVALNVSNILNVTRPVAAGTGKAIDGTPYASYALNPPRTISLRVSADF